MLYNVDCNRGVIMGFGQRVKEQREHMGMSQQELANKIGVSNIAVSSYESEKNYPKASIFIKILNTLNCDANYLFQDYKDFNSNFLRLTEKEEALIRQYRTINDAGKQIVNSIIHSFHYAYLEFRRKNGFLDLDYYVPISQKNGISFDGVKKAKIRILNDSLNTQADFVFQVVTTHLSPMYRPGDLLLVKQRPPYNGDLGLFRYNQNQVLYSRRLIFYDEKILLAPVNNAHSTLVLKNFSDIDCEGVILGKVIGNVTFV